MREPLGALFPKRDSQFAAGAGVVGEQGEQGGEGFVAAVEAEEQVLVEQDTDTSGAFIAAVTQGEEDVMLDAVSDEESAQGCIRKHGVGLLHGQGPPVVPTVLELLVGLLHQSVLLWAAERTQACGQGNTVNRGQCLSPLVFFWTV